MQFSFSYEEEKAPPKPRPSQTLAFQTKEPLARAEQDTVAAWRSWDLRVHGNAPWPDDEERRQLLADLGERAGEDRRLQALVRLRSLTAGVSGGRLWADEELRKLLLACANATAQSEYLAAQEEPQELRCAALGVLLQLLRLQENRGALLRDPDARGIVLLAMRRTHGEDVNARAALLFVALLVEVVRTEAIRDYEDFLRTFKAQADPELPPENREALYGALWSAATSQTADVKRLWKSEWLRPALLDAAGPQEESLEVRAAALGTLWALAGEDDDDKAKVWSQEAARLALVAGIRQDQRIDIRRQSINALATFAAVPELRAQLWHEVGIKVEDEEEEGADAEEARLPGDEPPPPLADELRACAEETQPVDIRLAALRILVDLSWERAIRRSMAWSGPPGVHTLLYKAVDDASIEIKLRRYYRFAYDRVAPLAPEVFALAMVRDRLTRFLLPEHLWLPEPRWWEAMGIPNSQKQMKRRHSWAGPAAEPDLAGDDAAMGRSLTDGWRGRRASVAPEVLKSAAQATAFLAASSEAQPWRTPAPPAADGGDGEAPEVAGQEPDAAGEAGEAGAGADVVEAQPEFVPEPDPPEYIDLGNVTRCVGARVMQPDAPDRRIGSIVSVEHGTLEVTVRWWDTTYDELQRGELSYMDTTKQGDPAEIPIPKELEGLAVLSQHGRVGVVMSAFRRPREAGERQVPLTVRIRWNPQMFLAKQLGPGGALVYIRSQDLKLTSRSVMHYVVPGPPAPWIPPPPPLPVAEEDPPPPERMKGRENFEDEEEYIRYVREKFKEHGGEVGAKVQFIDDVPFWGARKGLYGTIKEFNSMDAFKVKWDNGELLWTDMRRCQLQETANKAFIWAEEVPEPDFQGGGGIAGPSAEEIVTFPGAPVPVLRKWALGKKQESEHAAFTLFVQMRTNVKRQQHFLEYGSADGTRRALVLRLTEEGNLEYGEHIGSLSQGWRSAQLAPKRNLCDGKWHSIGVVRRDTGFLWLYVDDELAGQGLIGADLPPGLAPGPKSYRNVKKDFVFHGDLGPMRIWSTELTINQIRAVNLFAGNPKLTP